MLSSFNYESPFTSSQLNLMQSLTLILHSTQMIAAFANILGTTPAAYLSWFS